MKSVIILAGGSSVRFGENKLFTKIYGKPLIEATVEKFYGLADEIILVTSAADKDIMQTIFGDSVLYAVGGETRTRSVISGLRCVDPAAEFVAIHDAARPYVTKKLIEKCFLQAESTKSAVPVIKATDAILDGNNEIPRDNLYLVQTPQVFETQKLKKAYARFTANESDDSRVWLKAYGAVTYVEGERSNIKITYPKDVTQYIIGNGYDIHRLVKGRPLILGGVTVPFNKGLLGHSDADVIVHSLMDSMLSAVGEKDIGHLFPNTNPAYKDADSLMLLGRVRGIFESKNATVLSVSCAVVCEKPKLSPYLEQIKEKLSDALGISPDTVNISVTTAESVGEIGKGKAIACRTVILGVISN